MLTLCRLLVVGKGVIFVNPSVRFSRVAFVCPMNEDPVSVAAASDKGREGSDVSVRILKSLPLIVRPAVTRELFIRSLCPG